MGAPHDEDDQDPSPVDDPPGIEGDLGDETEDPAHGDEALGPSDDLGDDLDVTEDGNLDDAGADELDIGGVDFGFAERAPDDADAAGIAGSDEVFEPEFEDRADAGADEPHAEHPADELDDVLPATPDDGGAEGIGDGSEAELDETHLPAMDADAGGDFELHDLLKEMGFGDAEPWEAVGAHAADDALSCVACERGVVVAAGSAVALMDQGATTPRLRPLVEPAHACALTGDWVVLATRRGVEVTDLAKLSEPRVVLARPDVSAITLVGGTLWLLAGSSLMRLDVGTGAAELARDDVTSIGASGGTLYVGCASRGGRLERLRGDDGAFEGVRLEAAAMRALESGARLAAAAPGVVVLLGGGRCTLAFAEGRAVTVDVEDVVAAAVRASPPAARVLLLTHSDAALRLLEIDEGGRTTADVRLPVSAASGAAQHAVAWDAARELALVAGPHGLVALRPRLKH